MAATDATVSPGLALPPLTDEDLARSHDRARVHDAREHRKRWRLLWLLVGPGILAMLGENDGPSMIAYASDGAAYGLGFFEEDYRGKFVAYGAENCWRRGLQAVTFAEIDTLDSTDWTTFLADPRK